MSNNVICARVDLGIHPAIELMLAQHIGCLPIVDRRRRPIGMITKLDLVEQFEVALRPASKHGPATGPRTVGDVMLPLAISLPDTATVAQAALMMALEGMHHVLVLSDEQRLVGVVSTRDIVVWVASSGAA